MQEKECDGEFQESDVEFYREGNWYIVKLGGKIIKRRYSRGGAIVGVEVEFNNSRSPRYPRNWSTFISWGRRVEFLTKPPRRAPTRWNQSNSIYKQLEE